MRNVVLLTTALTTVLFMQFYRNNLLLSIVRPAMTSTPNTLEEIANEIEKGSLRLVFPTHASSVKRTLLDSGMNMNAP